MLLVFAAVSVALVGSAAGSLVNDDDIGTHLKVSYSIVPDPYSLFSLYNMPRTIAEGLNDHFAEAAVRTIDNTTIHCREQDYRVCVIFDAQGSVAGIQWSVAVSELDKSQLPFKVTASSEWFQQNFLGIDVYSTIIFFVPRDMLVSGGRPMDKKTKTAPDGVHILQTDESGNETGRLHVPAAQDKAEAVGFHEQACFHGMGKHYYQGVSADGSCDNNLPYFTLYGPRSKQMLGFGFVMFGKVSKGRGWYENPVPLVVKMIVPNAPKCYLEYVKKYSRFTMHVFFDKSPYNIWCLASNL